MNSDLTWVALLILLASLWTNVFIRARRISEESSTRRKIADMFVVILAVSVTIMGAEYLIHDQHPLIRATVVAAIAGFALLAAITIDMFFLPNGIATTPGQNHLAIYMIVLGTAFIWALVSYSGLVTLPELGLDLSAALWIAATVALATLVWTTIGGD